MNTRLMTFRLSEIDREGLELIAEHDGERSGCVGPAFFSDVLRRLIRDEVERLRLTGNGSGETTTNED